MQQSVVFGTFTTNRTWSSLRTELMGGAPWYGFVTIALAAIVMALASALLI
jgi:hypothetical protein